MKNIEQKLEKAIKIGDNFKRTNFKNADVGGAWIASLIDLNASGFDFSPIRSPFNLISGALPPETPMLRTHNIVVLSFLKNKKRKNK